MMLPYNTSCPGLFNCLADDISGCVGSRKGDYTGALDRFADTSERDC